VPEEETDTAATRSTEHWALGTGHRAPGTSLPGARSQQPLVLHGGCVTAKDVLYWQRQRV